MTKEKFLIKINADYVNAYYDFSEILEICLDYMSEEDIEKAFRKVKQNKTKQSDGSERKN